MKKFVMAIGIGLISGSLYAACVGPYCYDDTGASINGVTVNNLTTVGTITASTTSFSGGVLLMSQTLAQLNALTSSTTGQIAYCNNCTRANICVSTGTVNPGAWVVAIETGTFTAASRTHCL